ncbi:MAG TPA: hypothetical protein VHY10_14965, partial [Xanthobacteraceae bacterium]|nr:hypothetical protein [Xanthobacteraceae bacterium]
MTIVSFTIASEVIFAFADKFTHARLPERIAGNQRRAGKSGVDVLVYDGGLTHRRAVVHQGRDDAVRIYGEIFGFELIKLEQIDVPAGPGHALFLQGHAAANRTDGAPKVIKLDHAVRPSAPELGRRHLSFGSKRRRH